MRPNAIDNAFGGTPADRYAARRPTCSLLMRQHHRCADQGRA
jgi:hypothetical protein